MRKLAWLALLISGISATGASAEPWDHRGMQSHHRAAPPVEHPLAPGETRQGRITIGTPAAPAERVPDTLEQTTQRQWQQDRSLPTRPDRSRDATNR
ncbi:MAG: hypothetical protein ACREI8_05775 [Myxococcota bacterium]